MKRQSKNNQIGSNGGLNFLFLFIRLGTLFIITGWVEIFLSNQTNTSARLVQTAEIPSFSQSARRLCISNLVSGLVRNFKSQGTCVVGQTLTESRGANLAQHNSMKNSVEIFNRELGGRTIFGEDFFESLFFRPWSKRRRATGLC